MNDGIRRCPHGHPVVIVKVKSACSQPGDTEHYHGNWTEDHSPEICKLCKPNAILERYQLPEDQPWVAST